MVRDVATPCCSLLQSVSCIQWLLLAPAIMHLIFFFLREFISMAWRDFVINNNLYDLEVFHEKPIFLSNIK